MKKVKRIALIWAVASLSTIMVVGCNSAKTPNVTKNNTITKYSQTIKYDVAAIKNLYSKTLKTLVKAGTITQEQADKVLAAVIKDIPKKADGTSAQNPTSTATDGIVTDTDGTNNRNKINNAHDNHILSALIINKVLTQAQANTINQKLGEIMRSTQSTNTK